MICKTEQELCFTSNNKRPPGSIKKHKMLNWMFDVEHFWHMINLPVKEYYYSKSFR